ncbi:protein adenylyltransferase SelO [Salinicoccus carnicancri]|uniref:protein adenylyltransferase SelO n=1 Tax=Salinicoccus carnicancri TaxID=558170 RepID=UPI000476C6AE|nr:YdiU family protein [Salinicoccus carnicancri]
MDPFGFNFDNTFELLPDSFYRKAGATPVDFPEIVAFNSTLAAELGLDEETLQTDEGKQVFAGNDMPEGASSISQAYAGHQFGNLSMLGDGRAVLIGEQVTPEGERFDLQLKGSGRTVFSRSGDGRAPIGPMLREYIISEAIHALGIKTSRSLAVVTTGEGVTREEILPGGILTRVAKSHLRVGTFEYAVRTGNETDIKTLADYAISRHYPELEELPDSDKYMSFLKSVIRNQAALISDWMLVGFIHGVMNTDNMTISGETIDYGPCAFMDAYHPETVYSSIDINGRYKYQNQPAIGQWNLARFAETLLTLIADDKDEAITLAQDALSEYGRLYEGFWLDGMRKKLGLTEESEDDEAFITELLDMMVAAEADYTQVFRMMAHGRPEKTALAKAEGFGEWHSRWQQKLGSQKTGIEAAYELMKSVNPAVIPRNHLVEKALDEAMHYGDYSHFNKLNEVLAKPYDDSHEDVFKTPPEASEAVLQTFCGT